MDNTTTFNSTNSTSDPFTTTPKGFDWFGLLLPIAYLTILIGSLATFSSLYRKRKIARSAQLEPWFATHLTRDIYLSLLHMDPAEGAEGGDEKKLSRVPDSVLKAALLRRAVEDINRIIQIRSGKPALQTLLQRGSVGDELWQRFLRAEKEIEEEVKDVVNEVGPCSRAACLRFVGEVREVDRRRTDRLTLQQANAFAPNWGQTIFQSANEINQNILIKAKTAELHSQLEQQKSWWETKKAGIQSDFMKELESGSEESQPAIQKANKPKVEERKSSEEDAVLVEAGGPSAGAGSGGKKKGKK